MSQSPTYAENLLYHAGFQFHPRSGERLDLVRISKVDIERIVDEVDIKTLSSFLENITFSEITEEDLRLHGDDCFVRLFQLAHLTIEYLVDAQDTLSSNLNGLAKKCDGRKREVERLSKSLARQDAEVTTLRDELYYHRQFVKKAVGSVPSEVLGRVDPSIYPSQERRHTAPAGREDASSSGSSSEKAGQEDGTLRLHVVSSTHALCFQMRVNDSLTVRNLKNKLVGRILVVADDSVDSGSYALYYKDKELKDPSQTLKHYQVANDAALILMSRPAEKAMIHASIEDTAKTSDEAPDIKPEEVEGGASSDK